MRKLLDTKAGATFYEEMPNLTLCTRKDCIEFIFKLKPGIYVIINMTRGTGGKIMLYANWDKYFMRMQNPDVQLPRIKKNCPTLFAVLTGEDKDDLNTTPPFPAWKDGLRDLWNWKSINNYQHCDGRL